MVGIVAVAQLVGQADDGGLLLDVHIGHVDALPGAVLLLEEEGMVHLVFLHGVVGTGDEHGQLHMDGEELVGVAVVAGNGFLAPLIAAEEPLLHPGINADDGLVAVGFAVEILAQLLLGCLVM